MDSIHHTVRRYRLYITTLCVKLMRIRSLYVRETLEDQAYTTHIPIYGEIQTNHGSQVYPLVSHSLYTGLDITPSRTLTLSVFQLSLVSGKIVTRMFTFRKGFNPSRTVNSWLA